MLRGLNNVTSRIRYYSFYCWLMDAFIGDNPSVKPVDQPVFIRRAEYLLALIQTKTNDSLGIPGINYASARKDNKVFDLKEGTYNSSGKTQSGTYFANPGGVFSQYYARSLNDIKLIGENGATKKKERLFVVSQDEGHVNGRALAEAFANSIGTTNAERFLRCVKGGEADAEDLEALAVCFNMKSFVNAEKERDLLVQTLMQEDFLTTDEPTYYRKETLLHFLKYIYNAPGKDHNLDFPKYLYNSFLKVPSDDPVTVGWYAYYLNDNYQYQASILLKHLLGILKDAPYDGLWVELDVLVKTTAAGITEELAKQGYTETVADIITKLQAEEPRWHLARQAYPAMAIALLNLFYLTTVNEPHMERVKETLTSCFGWNGGVDDFFRFIQLVKENEHLPIEDFICVFLDYHIIRKHYRVAMRKYHQTGIASYKFLLEDGYIRFLDKIDATHMDSRIATVADFLKELDLYDNNGLRPLGEDTLLLEEWL